MTTYEKKLIAEFMGFRPESENDDRYHGMPESPYKYDVDHYKMQTTYTPENMKYDTSWDWLMPVLKKCWESVSEFQYDSEDYEHITEEIFHPDYSLSELMHGDINAVCNRVVKFIKYTKIVTI